MSTFAPSRRQFLTHSTSTLTTGCLLAVTASLFDPASAVAAEKEKESPAGNTLSVEVPGLVLPVARNGNLINYLFAVMRVEVGDNASADFLRQRSFLVRDAVVKVASKSPVLAGETRGAYDTASLIRIVDVAVKAVRPGIVIRSIQVVRGALMR